MLKTIFQKQNQTSKSRQLYKNFIYVLLSLFSQIVIVKLYFKIDNQIVPFSCKHVFGCILITFVDLFDEGCRQLRLDYSNICNYGNITMMYVPWYWHGLCVCLRASETVVCYLFRALTLMNIKLLRGKINICE